VLERWLERLPPWVPGPRRVFLPLAVGVLLALAAGLFFEETRWNFVAELWGVAGAGVLVWLLLEPLGEAVQRYAWVRRSAEQLVPVVRVIHDCATATGASALGFPENLQHELRGPTREGRRRAARLVAEGVGSASEQGDAAHVRFRDRGLRIGVRLGSSVVLGLADANAPMLARLPNLHAAITRYAYRCQEFLKWAPSLFP
jgi:hypothetical protein